MRLEQLKYPIGRFTFTTDANNDTIAIWKQAIRLFVSQLNEVIKDLSVTELNWQYHPNDWSLLLDRLKEEKLLRTYFHPQQKQLFSTKETIGMYNWHCKHHLGYIQQALHYKIGFAFIKVNQESKQKSTE